MKRLHLTIIAIVVLLCVAIVADALAHYANRPVIASAPAGVASQEPSLPIPADEQVPILVYHRVEPKSTVPESKMAAQYHIYPENFQAQMQYLKDHGYTPITLNALAQYYLTGAPLPAKPIVLTFDDGWRDQYTYAYPILKKFGFVASFFIISSYPDGNYPAYMSWDQIRDLDKTGMEIGSHTVHHVNLATVSDPAQVNSELVDSKSDIEKQIGHVITTFVYPEYGQNPAVQADVKAAGYIAARAGWGRGPNGPGTIYALTSREAVNNTNPFSRVPLQ